MANQYEHEFHQYKMELEKEAAEKQSRIDSMVAMDFYASPQFPDWDLYKTTRLSSP